MAKKKRAKKTTRKAGKAPKKKVAKKRPAKAKAAKPKAAPPKKHPVKRVIEAPTPTRVEFVPEVAVPGLPKSETAASHFSRNSEVASQGFAGCSVAESFSRAVVE